MLDFNNHPAVPQHTREALERYIEQGIPTGDFLKCVLCNNLVGAVGLADHWNIAGIKDIASWIWLHAPQDCWGSEAKYLRWLKEFPHKQRAQNC